ncbi:MAG TPA: hypothetical protein VN040_24290 [Pseudosphingobacterium sp.]|nr:hypothetical protein [Pseudosphingobacterium sp.]
MTFDYKGYELKFIQKKKIKDGTAHLFSLIYKFYSPITQLTYILTADYHKEDFFAVKFYAKIHRKSDFKYSLIINRGDLGNIIITCLKCVPILLKQFPAASFGFIGSRTYDKKSRRLENYIYTQRYSIYKYVTREKIGSLTFQHYEYDEISGYLLVNRNCGIDIDQKERRLAAMLAQTYSDLPNP